MDFETAEFVEKITRVAVKVFRERGYEVSINVDGSDFEIEASEEVTQFIIEEVIDEAARRIGATKE